MAIAIGAMVAAVFVLAVALPSSRLAAQSAESAKIPEEELDVTEAIREHFRIVLPTTWWATYPERKLLGFQVTVHLPLHWYGNPTAAVMQFCPGREDRIWEQAQSLTIIPFYKKLPWPGVECTPRG